jgi:uncharacterized protein (TIRG00374 family)
MTPKLFSTILGVILVGSSLLYVFEAIELSDIWGLISSAHIPTLCIFFACSLSMAYLRTWRYQILLSGSGHAPRMYPLFLITLVRNLFADLLPAKMGTLVYVGLITTRLGIPLPAALSSWGYEYVLDVLALFPIVCIAILLSTEALPASISTIVFASTGAIVASIALALLLPRILNFSTKLVDKLLAQRYPRASEKLHAIEHAILGMQRGRVLIPATLLSLAIRTLKYVGLYLVLLALLFPIGYSAASLKATKVFFGFISAEFVAALPLPSLAGFGAYQGAWSFAFQFLGFPEHTAKLSSVAHHLFTQGYAYGLGAFSYLLLLLYRRGVESPTMPLALSKFLLRYVFKIAAIALVLIVSISWIHPTSPAPTTDSPTTRTLPSLSGLVVFDSNRSGTFGIYALNPNDASMAPLVDTTAHEMHPQISPDAKAVAYTVAQSPHRLAAMDTWILEDGSAPRLLIKDAAYPTFSSDGKFIYFQRNRSSIWRFDRPTGEEVKVFPTPGSSFEGRVITIPRLSPDANWVSFTSNFPEQWVTWAVNLGTGEKIRIGVGCQPYWSEDSKHVYFIQESGTRAGSGIFRYDLTNRETSEVLDEGGRFGKEYFPSIGKNGALLWAASSKERHSHIDGGYQLFIKKDGIKVQLTDDTATNRWPILAPR